MEDNTLSNEQLINKVEELQAKVQSKGITWCESVQGMSIENYTDFVISTLVSRLKQTYKKAERWDKLDEEIGKYYQEEEDEDYDDEFEGNLCDIGETAASAFGYL